MADERHLLPREKPWDVSRDESRDERGPSERTRPIIFSVDLREAWEKVCGWFGR